MVNKAPLRNSRQSRHPSIYLGKRKEDPQCTSHYHWGIFSSKASKKLYHDASEALYSKLFFLNSVVTVDPI